MALTIDCQVHAYRRNTPEHPWVGFLTGPEEVTGDDMVAAMDAVGVDGAILISPFVIYGYDASYALEVYAQHPTKFGLVRPFDPNSATIDADVEEWTSTPGVDVHASTSASMVSELGSKGRTRPNLVGCCAYTSSA